MKLVALLSGGQDSVTSLYWALASGHDVVNAVAFDYGQRHSVEIDLARYHADRNGIPFRVMEISMPSLSILTGETSSGFADERGLPSSFTPGRNLLFFTYAAQIAASVAECVLAGVCEQDEAGYPDCRPRFITAMEIAIREGFDWPSFTILTPLLHSSKAKTWAIADKLDILNEIVENTNTCYLGVRGVLHDWGFGCGECGACVERRKGYEEWRQGELR